MVSIEKYCAPGVYDPPGYSQGIKVTGAQTILFLAGQVAYYKDGGVAHRGDFTGQARDVFGARNAEKATAALQQCTLRFEDYSERVINALHSPEGNDDGDLT